MSEQVRQRQVTLNEGKTLVNTNGVYGSKFGNETHFLSFAVENANATSCLTLIFVSALICLFDFHLHYKSATTL